MSIPEKVYALVHSNKTLTAAFATATTGSDHHDHDVSPGHLARTLYEQNPKKHSSLSGGGHIEAFKGLFQHSGKKNVERIQAIKPTQEDIDLAAQCGDFGSRPSDLFLKVSTILRCLSWQLYIRRLQIYVDVLATLDSDPWAGVVSPPLLGSRGVVNLSIISL